jgi:lipoic acid synthetase
VPRLYAEVRPQAVYERSLELLRRAASWTRGAASERPPASGPVSSASPTRSRMLVKSGLMVGLGETPAEVTEVLARCAAAAVDLVTIGQYLQPGRDCLPVARFVAPSEFRDYERRGAALGLKVVAAPFVRSSYHAGELLAGKNDADA